MARLFNMREGVRRTDDRLPARFSEDLPLHKGVTPEQQDEIVTRYYTRQGWDAGTGLPAAETLAELGLEMYEPIRAQIVV
jgi:aldehyde:ferredoxin oxidoreductase